MGRVDRRLLVAVLCAISLTLAATMLVGRLHGNGAVWWNAHWALIRHLIARKNCAAAIQAVGALITFYGLLRAYLRAKYDQPIRTWLKNRVETALRTLFRCPRQVTPTSGSAAATYGWTVGPAYGFSGHQVDITLTAREQIKQLAEHVNKRSREAIAMQKSVDDLGRDLKRLADGAVELERSLLARFETRLDQFDGRLNTTQVLDLTLAIWGLGITFAGTLLGFGA